MALETLRANLQRMGQEWNRPVEELSPGVFRLDVPLVYKDGTSRNQFVFARVTPQFARGQDVYYITSRAGRMAPSVSLYQMMKEAGLGVYSMVTIIDDKDENGNPCETLLVQASPICTHTSSYELLRYIVEEVASVADYMESRYFGGTDNN